MTPLTPEKVHAVLQRFFPSGNNDFECDYVEELQELADFGVITEEQLADLLRRRADEVMAIDRSPMDDTQVRNYAVVLGEEFVARRLQQGFWFSYPALLRLGLELEFGAAYEAYANRRDGMAEPPAAPQKGPTSVR